MSSTKRRWLASTPGVARLATAALAAALLSSISACVAGNPPWTAPGIRLVYHSQGAGRAGIRLLIAREGNEIALTRGTTDGAPAYDRRSGWVYFESRDADGWNLHRVRLSGEERASVTATPGVNERSPVLAPDGSMFFTSDAGGTSQIWRSDSTGQGTTAVTSGPEAHSLPAIDSSGTRLVALQGSLEGEARLVSVDAVSGDVTPLAKGAVPPPAGRPAVKGDGTLVYACRGEGGLDICSLSPDGKAARLTSGAADDVEPAWSPDGSLVVFSSDRDGNFELYAMRADGSRVRRLTKERGPDGEPSWVP